jgi:hypothetical protein
MDSEEKVAHAFKVAEVEKHKADGAMVTALCGYSASATKVEAEKNTDRPKCPDCAFFWYLYYDSDD